MNHVFIPNVLAKFNHEFSWTAFCSSDVHSKVSTAHANKRVIFREKNKKILMSTHGFSASLLMSDYESFVTNDIAEMPRVLGEHGSTNQKLTANIQFW